MDNEMLGNSEEQQLYATNKGKGITPTPGFNKMSGI